ncbi:MAG TPA: hypothetical protein VLY63_15085, partial [Anaerolineae bacterium]|nr:hypothetical protein [Anaerolineae bacterium]
GLRLNPHGQCDKTDDQTDEQRSLGKHIPFLSNFIRANACGINRNPWAKDTRVFASLLSL